MQEIILNKLFQVEIYYWFDQDTYLHECTIMAPNEDAARAKVLADFEKLNTHDAIKEVFVEEIPLGI